MSKPCDSEDWIKKATNISGLDLERSCLLFSFPCFLFFLVLKKSSYNTTSERE